MGTLRTHLYRHAQNAYRFQFLIFSADNILVQRLESKSQPSDICMMCNVQFTNVLEHNKVHTEQFLIHYRPKMTLKNGNNN